MNIMIKLFWVKIYAFAALRSQEAAAIAIANIGYIKSLTTCDLFELYHIVHDLL